ncbi:MAG: ABC transporter permease subunit [Acidimicrobiia bacterium]|nr:ABC transporter permease subunit [Acidimicrobiia bacterium]
MNPVARRELQERFRSLRSPLLLSVWVLAAGALTFLSYLIARSTAESRLGSFGLSGLGSVFAASSMGAFILHSVLLGLLTAVVFVVPGQAAVTIVGERERQTLPLLQVSQLSGWRIITGKLASSLAFILLLLVVALPLLVIPVLLGGVTVLQAVMGMAMVAGTAVTIGAISMWISARAKGVQGAVLGSYVVSAALVMGSFALVAAEVLLLRPDDTGSTRYSQGMPRDDGRELYSSWINPYLGLVDASSDVLRFGGEIVTSPYQPFRSVLIKRQGFAAASVDQLYDPFARFGGGFADGQAILVREGGVFDGGFVAQAQMLPSPTEVDPIRGHIWWRVLIFQALVTALALWRSSRLVTVPRRRVIRSRAPQEAPDAA